MSLQSIWPLYPCWPFCSIYGMIITCMYTFETLFLWWMWVYIYMFKFDPQLTHKNEPMSYCLVVNIYFLQAFTGKMMVSTSVSRIRIGIIGRWSLPTWKPLIQSIFPTWSGCWTTCLASALYDGYSCLKKWLEEETAEQFHSLVGYDGFWWLPNGLNIWL